MARKVLVVDDETEVVKSLKRILEGKGYQVETAFDGVEAVKQALTVKPDIILLDIMMPKRDGFSVLAELRNTEATKNIPIVMLSAKGEISSLEEARFSGATDYIIKPFDVEELLKFIKKYIILSAE